MMVDVLTKKQRQYCMSRIRGKDTKPEMVVRKLVHSLGYRYRLHVKKLPGCPDLVFPCHKKAIFVHGCFWHMHNCRYGRVIPKTNKSFWEKKRNENVRRNTEQIRTLKQLGWKVMIVWECWTKNVPVLERRIKKFLTPQCDHR
jgi:DNA mismatch endonuclease (patch repair protein)